MRSLTIFGLLFMIFASCQREEKIVFIEFDHSEGIKTKDQVLLNGASVGTVLDVDITKDYKVITTVQLSDSVDFPKDTYFEIQSQDLFTNKIFVTLGEWKTFLKNGDTIQGLRRVHPQDACESPPPKLLDDIKEMLKN